mgnify:CR=1 FL=1
MEELKDKGIEIVPYDNKVFNANEKIVVETFSSVKKTDTLSEEEIEIVEKVQYKNGKNSKG